MQFSCKDYLELPAPLTVTLAALRDTATWTALPTGAERFGNFWRWGNELYTLQFYDSLGGNEPPDGAVDQRSTTLTWRLAPVTGSGPILAIELALYEAVISTHAVIAVHWHDLRIWRWPIVQRRIRSLITACATGLAGLLRDQLITPLHHDTPAMAVAEPVAVRSAGAATQPVHWQTPRGRPASSNLTTTPDWIEALRERYPQTVAAFEAMNARQHLAQISRLEAGWERILRGEVNPSCYVADWQPTTGNDVSSAGSPAQATQGPAFDLIYAGGGLGLLHAVVMARRYGRKVLLFDRGEVGCAHREWNISRTELQALVDLGIVSWDELAEVVMREYRDGIVRFYASPFSTWAASAVSMPAVLNLALDAGALLRLMRRKLEAAGGVVLDRRAFRQVRVCAGTALYVEVDLAAPGSEDDATAVETYRARLLLDGMGSTSPLALLRHIGRPFAGVCPTVGTVARGFKPGNGPREFDAGIGDILVSVADAQQGRQLMWEGFPGRRDELTVYLFYYATVNPRPPVDENPYSLFDLFEQYFRLLPTYKEPGPDFAHIKPVYGYIPGRHSLQHQEAPLLRGVLPVGDAAARQSPLTFCGFGSHIRNLNRTTILLDYALRHELLEPDHLRHVTAAQINVALNWIFSRFMHPWHRPHDVNQIQNIFLHVIAGLSPAVATRFFQDQMRWSDYHAIIAGIRRRYRRILWIALQVLGPRELCRWLGEYYVFSLIATMAGIARRAGRHSEYGLYRLCERLAPEHGLRVRAAYAEWRAMGWL